MLIIFSRNDRLLCVYMRSFKNESEEMMRQKRVILIKTFGHTRTKKKCDIHKRRDMVKMRRRK